MLEIRRAELGGMDPAQAAAPVDQAAMVGFQFQLRRGGWQDHPPQRLVVVEKGVGVIANTPPQGFGLGFVEGFPAQFAGGLKHPGLGTFEAQQQSAIEIQLAADRQLSPGQPVHRADGFVLVLLEGQGSGQRGHGNHLQGDLEHRAEAAAAAAEQARDIVAGDILHHLAAEVQDLAVVAEQLHAEHMVADGAAEGPGGSAVADCHGAAEAGVVGITRKVRRQLLPALGQYLLDLAQRGAGAGAQGQFGGLVIDDAPVPRQLQALRLGKIAKQEIVAAGAMHGDGRLARDGVAQLLLQFAGMILIGSRCIHGLF